VNTNRVQTAPLDLPTCDRCEPVPTRARWLIVWQEWADQPGETLTIETYVCSGHLLQVLERATGEPDIPVAEVVSI